MFVWRDCSWRTCQLLFVCKVFFSHPVGTSEKCGETGVILAIMISNLLSFTAFLHGVLVSYGAFVCVLLKDCPPLFATKVIHGIMVPSFFCISKVFVWKCVWPLYLSLSLYLSPTLSPCGSTTHVIWCSLPNILFLINFTFVHHVFP